MRRPSFLLATLLTLLTPLAHPHSASAQGVSIAPQFIVIDPRTRSAAVTLLNQSDDPVELSLETFYGYPVTDSAGIITLRAIATVDDTMPSAAAWIRIFPERLRLEPRSRRTVRLLIDPPTGTKEGEYWARLAVTARNGKIQLSGIDETTGVRIGLAVEVRSIMPMFYRHGTVTTGVELGHATATVANDSLIARVPLTRTGSAAFLGTISATLRDALGHVVSTGTLPVGVYYTLDPRVSMPLAGVKPGRYQLTLAATSRIPSLPAQLQIAAGSVQSTVAIDVP